MKVWNVVQTSDYDDDPDYCTTYATEALAKQDIIDNLARYFARERIEDRALNPDFYGPDDETEMFDVLFAEERGCRIPTNDELFETAKEYVDQHTVWKVSIVECELRDAMIA